MRYLWIVVMKVFWQFRTIVQNCTIE